MSKHAFIIGMALTALLASNHTSHGQTVTNGPQLTVVSYRFAKVWVRISDPGAEVKVLYGTDPNFPIPGSYTSPEITTSASSDNVAILDIQPPSPPANEDQLYYYKVLVNGEDATPGHQFRFLKPLTSASSFKFVVMADVQDAVRRNETVPSYASAANETPRFAVFLGDLDHRNPQFLSSRRSMYRDHRSLPSQGGNAAGNDFNLSFIAPEPPSSQVPVFYMWDNHDFGGGDKFSTDRCAAWQAFKEYWPTPTLSSAPPTPCSTAPNEVGMWYKFQCGKCDFIVLDCRSQKDPTAHKMLGDTQLQWFKNRLKEGRSRQWQFVLSSVTFNPTVKAGIPFSSDPALGSGSWGAFESERNDIINYMANPGDGIPICNVVWISGDVHSGGAADDAHTGISNISGNSYNSGPALRCLGPRPAATHKD